jgi:glycosyltransferase involved in cell wall biosynthesis
MTTSPLVSIIIPTYNRAALLKKALESARKQTYPNIEIIVVNDGSTDNTEEALASYRDDIIYIKQENQGLPTTKNVGLSRASGEFIAILDDDDLFLPEKIERQVEMFRENPLLGVCATGAYYIDADDRITGTCIPPTISRKTQVLQLLRQCLFIQSSVMVRRKLHDELGNYKLILSSDYEFWLRSALHYPIGVIKEPLTMYRRHKNQLTSEKYHPILAYEAKELILDIVLNAPIQKIIPSLQDEKAGYAILGLILSERRFYFQSEEQFKKALPSSAGIFGLGMLSIIKRDYDQAKAYFERVSPSHPLAAKVSEALSFIARIKEITQKPSVNNASPEAVSLRKDFSKFYSSVIRENLFLCLKNRRK